jgi:plastocyanin
VAPAELRIKAWSRVMFVNNDTRSHTIVSDPVDVHTQCPPVNQVGLLNPGESRTTGTLNLTGTCGFHDHGNKTDASLMGRIVVE